MCSSAQKSGVNWALWKLSEVIVAKEVWRREKKGLDWAKMDTIREKVGLVPNLAERVEQEKLVEE